MNITVIEANMTGLQHSYPNGIYTKMLADIISEEGKINLYCEKEHFNQMDILNYENIVFHNIHVVPGNRHMIKKFFVEFFETFRIIKLSKDKIIVLLSSCPDIQLPLIKYASRIRNRQIFIFTHGELEGILRNDKWKIWSYPFWISMCFMFKNPPNVTRIVLGKSIKKNLMNIYSNCEVSYIDQPRDRFVSDNSVLPLLKENIYGFIGDCMDSKGANCIYQFDKQMSNDSNSKILIIGRCLTKNKSRFSDNVSIVGNGSDFLSIDLFEKAIDNITYACYPYPPDTYKLTASGAILDAIRHLKPIIYIKNDYFDCIFEKAGDIGFRCNNEDEFCKTLSFLENHVQKDRYLVQVTNLKKLQMKFSVKTIKERLQKIIIKNEED